LKGKWIKEITDLLEEGESGMASKVNTGMETRRPKAKIKV